MSRLFSPLVLYRRLPRFRGFSSRFRDRGLPRPVPTFLQLDEDEAQEGHSSRVLRLYRRRRRRRRLHRLAFAIGGSDVLLTF